MNFKQKKIVKLIKDKKSTELKNFIKELSKSDIIKHYHLIQNHTYKWKNERWWKNIWDKEHLDLRKNKYKMEFSLPLKNPHAIFKNNSNYFNQKSNLAKLNKTYNLNLNLINYINNSPVHFKDISFDELIQSSWFLPYKERLYLFPSIQEYFFNNLPKNQQRQCLNILSYENCPYEYIDVFSRIYRKINPDIIKNIDADILSGLKNNLIKYSKVACLNYINKQYPCNIISLDQKCSEIINFNFYISYEHCFKTKILEESLIIYLRDCLTPKDDIYHLEQQFTKKLTHFQSPTLRTSKEYKEITSKKFPHLKNPHLYYINNMWYDDIFKEKDIYSFLCKNKKTQNILKNNLFKNNEIKYDLINLFFFKEAFQWSEKEYHQAIVHYLKYYQKENHIIIPSLFPEIFTIISKLNWTLSVKNTVALLSSSKEYFLTDDYWFPVIEQSFLANIFQKLFNLNIELKNKKTNIQELQKFLLRKELQLKSHNFKLYKNIKLRKHIQKINKKNKEYKFILIKTNKELLKYAELFDNCLGDYGLRCRNHKSQILICLKNRQNYAVIHINKGQVLEIKRKYNKKLSPKETKLLKNYLKTV